MTERSTVNSSTILGANYEVITLTSNNYNPTIDEQVVITATVKDVYGDPITGKSLQLYLNGTSMGSEYISITNSSGLATWTVTCDSWGLQTYSAGSKEIQVNVTGWKTVSLGISYATFYVNEAIRMCELRYVREFSSATGDTFYTWHSSAIPEDYRPPAQVNGAINQVGTLYVDSNGEIGGKFANSFSSTRNCKASVIWHY